MIDWSRWSPGSDAQVVTTIDTHAAGEPLRIVTGGLPELPGDTILLRRRYMQEHFDHVRRALMWEPRGHFNMYGAIVTPPVTAGADLGVLFMHNEGYSTMCGHGIIALVTALIETGALPVAGARTAIKLDTPAGLVRATAYLDPAGKVVRVSFLNVPSFVYARDVGLEAPPYGRVLVDIAFGGAFYAFLPADRVGLRVAPEQTAELVRAGEAIKRAVNASIPIVHPFEAELGFMYGTILTGPAEVAQHHSRNICVFANGEVDRSPTGTGVSARLALLHAGGELSVEQEIEIESIVGRESTFRGRIAELTRVGEYAAVVPEVSGTAYITGRHEFILNPRDALGAGFLVESLQEKL